MIKKTLKFLCALFIFTPSFVVANETYKPYNIKVNNILVNRDVANKIFNNARNHNIGIYNANDRNEEVTIVTEGKDVTIENSPLMDKVTELYSQTVGNHEEDDIVCKKSFGNMVVIYVKIKKEEEFGTIVDLADN